MQAWHATPRCIHTPERVERREGGMEESSGSKDDVIHPKHPSHTHLLSLEGERFPTETLTSTSVMGSLTRTRFTSSSSASSLKRKERVYFGRRRLGEARVRHGGGRCTKGGRARGAELAALAARRRAALRTAFPIKSIN